MQVLDTFLDAMGDTPLVRLHSVTRGVQATVLAKVEMLNPGGSVKDRIGIRMIEAAERAGTAEARRDDRRAHERQHGARPRDRRGDPGLQVHLRDARQDEPGEDRAAARLRRRGDHHAHRGGPRFARVVTTGWPTGSPKRSPAPSSRTSTGTRRTRRPTTRPPARRSGRRPTARIDVFVAGVGTGRHDQRRRSLPEGAEPRRHDRRRRPRGIASTRATSLARTWSRASARTSCRARSTPRSSIARSGCSDRDAFLTARAVTRQEGILVGWLVRVGGLRRARGGARTRRFDTTSSCCCPTPAASTCRRSTPTPGCCQYGFLDRARPDPRREVLAAKGAPCRPSSPSTPTTRSAKPSTCCSEHDISQAPVVREEGRRRDAVRGFDPRPRAARAGLPRPRRPAGRRRRGDGAADPHGGMGPPDRVGVRRAGARRPPCSSPRPGQVLGVLTRSDLLDFLAHRRQTQR